MTTVITRVASKIGAPDEAEVVALPDGTRLAIRRLTGGAGDRARVRCLLAECSVRDRQWRASTPSPDLALPWLLPRGPGDLALAAVDPSGAFAAVVNVNRSGADTVEVGLLVGPWWRRRGLGRSLVLMAAEAAPAAHEILAVLNSDNVAAVQLATSLGAVLADASLDVFEYRLSVGDRDAAGIRQQATE